MRVTFLVLGLMFALGCEESITVVPSDSDSPATNDFTGASFDGTDVTSLTDDGLSAVTDDAVTACDVDKGVQPMTLLEFLSACESGAAGAVWPFGLDEGTYEVFNSNVQLDVASRCCYSDYAE